MFFLYVYNQFFNRGHIEEVFYDVGYVWFNGYVVYYYFGILIFQNPFLFIYDDVNFFAGTFTES